MVEWAEAPLVFVEIPACPVCGHQRYVRIRTDDTGSVERLSQQATRGIFEEAAREPDDARRNSLSKWAIASESRGRQEAMIALAASQATVAISHRELNQHAYLLNCRNGTVDLRTGELLPHAPAHLITQSTGVDYATNDAPPRLWLDTLDRIFGGDTDLMDFLQRLCGLTLLGEVLEHLLAIFHGDGGNGKSLIVETLMGVLGGYAIKAPRDFCIARSHEGHPTQIADLAFSLGQNR